MRLAPIPNFSGTLQRMPGGIGSPYFTLRKMRELVRQWKTYPALIQTATSIIYTTAQHDTLGEATAIFEAVRDNIRYMSDVAGIEVLATPYVTLQRGVGDCDDKATLLATLFEIIGLTTRFVIAGYSAPNVFEHVYNQVLVDGNWLDADSTESQPLGYAPPFPVALDYERL